MKRICSNCHFMCKELNTVTPVGIQKFRFSLKGEEREKTRKNDFSFLRDGEGGKEIFLCHRGVWDEGHLRDSTFDRNEEFNKIPRNDCFFFKYKPDMFLDTALELESKKKKWGSNSPIQSENKKTLLKEKDKNSLVKKPKKWWNRWQARLTFIVAMLTILTFLLDFPKKIKDFTREIFGEPKVTCSLKGVVVNSQGMPVQGAEVKVELLPGESIMTTSDGSFKFDKVPAKIGDSTRVYVYYMGVLKRDEYVALPGPIRIILDDQ